MKKFFLVKGIMILLFIITLGGYMFMNIKTNTYPWFNTIQVLRHSIDYVLGFISLIIFISLLFKNKYLKIIGWIFLLLFFINILVSATCYFIYRTTFSIEMAYNIINTNLKEASSFSNTMVIPIIFSIVYIILYCILTIRVSKLIKINIWYILISLVWIVLPIFWLKKEQRDIDKILNENKDLLFVRDIKSKNVFFNLKEFKKAYESLNDGKKVKLYKLDPNQLEKTSNIGVENVIIVVGESERKQNMSLYGYERETTPIEDKERENMLLYNDAVSPAPFTHQAVPLTLSNVYYEDFSKGEYINIGDNVVTVADYLGYPVYWVSHFRFSEEIMLTYNALDFKELSTENGLYDEKLLDYFYKSLRKEGKKMIVLHLRGSHVDAGGNYPKDQIVYEDNTTLDKYDNSIHYTDFVLGEIFKELKGTNSAVVYYSDHGQQYKSDRFFHSERKESNKVPLFVWYSDGAPKEIRKVGVVEKQTSTRVVYDKVLELMGYRNKQSISKDPIMYLEKGRLVLFNNLQE